MLTNIFIAMLITSFIGTMLTLLLIIIKPITRKYFSSAWHYYIWIVVLAIMILPIQINLPSRNSMQSTINNATVSNYATQVDIQDTESINNAENTPIDNYEIPTQPEFHSTENQVQNKLTLDKNIIYNFMQIKLLEILSTIWLTVMLILLILKLVLYFVFLSKIKRNSVIVDLPEIKYYTDKRITIRKNQNICSPFLIGIFKPMLVLPQSELNTNQVENILAHEMVHFKRKDIWFKWFTSIVKCIHWFNPIVHYISNQINIECEVSCDLEATRNMDNSEKLSYINTILNLLSDNNSKTIPLTTGMAGKKSVLKRRFTEIKNAVKINKTTTVISVIIAVLIIVTTVFASGILNTKASDTLLGESASVTSNKNSSENQNFLFLGVDEEGRADTIILFSISNNNISGLSIPRNVLLTNDTNPRRVSDILLEENGELKVLDAIQRRFSIPVRYYIKASLPAIKEITNIVGDIEFDVPIDMIYDDPYKDLHINLPKGKQKLNGEQICHLLQFRRRNDGTGYENGDFTRMEVGHQFITEFIKQKLSKENIDKIYKSYQDISKHITTNIPTDEIFEYINSENHLTNMYSLPGTNVVSDSNMLVYEVDYINTREILDKFGFSPSISNKQSILYKNDNLGFSVRFPSSWKDKYEVFPTENIVQFVHKGTFMKFSKGSGVLFYIQRINISEIENVMQSAEPKRIIYQNDKYAYIFSTPSDVQYPIWVDKSEYDTKLTEEYEAMMSDLLFIENSFTAYSDPGYNAVDFTDDEINSARVVVEQYFKAKQEHNKEELLETLTDWHNSPNVVFWQDEHIILNNISFDMYDHGRRAYINYGRGSVNGTTYDNVIVFKVDYTVSLSQNNKSAYNNGKYKNWSMILIRDDKNSPWKIDDMGY